MIIKDFYSLWVFVSMKMKIQIKSHAIWVFPIMKNIEITVDFLMKKLDNQLLLGDIKD